MQRLIKQFGITVLIASGTNFVGWMADPLLAEAAVITLADGGRCEAEIINGQINGKGVFSPSLPSTSTGVVENRNVLRNGHRTGSGGVRCVSGCYPKFPTSLEGLDIEGRTVFRLTIEPDGTPSNLEIVESSGNKLIDDAAREVALQMRFTPPEGRRISIRVPINFATSNSDFDR